MRVLGIDPGTVVMGYGVIEGQHDELALVDYGTFNCSQRSPIGERLSFLYNELLKIIQRHRPEVVAVEQPFVAKNVRTALVIGRAQTVAILAAANSDIPACEYTPAEVKQMVTSFGGSSKGQVQEMVRLQLALCQAPQPEDAADALAVAICHLRKVHLQNMLDSQQ